MKLLVFKRMMRLRNKPAMTVWIVLMLMLACSVSSFANDTIRFTWQAGTAEKSFAVIAFTFGETFIVNWGNDSAETHTVQTSGSITLRHTYAIAGSYDVMLTTNTPNCKFIRLICSGNQLTTLNVSNNTALKGLYCYDNNLTSLDVNGCTALEEFECYNNLLTDLNVSGYTALEKLKCYNNLLTGLNVSGCTALTTLWCENNQLTSLDVSSCTALEELDCSDNQLTILNVSNNTALETLWCEENRLTSLNLSNNTALTTLWCYDNHLPLSDLYVASEILENNGASMHWGRGLGSQTLAARSVSVGVALFSDQAEFGGTHTAYTVKQGDNPAPTSDYTVNNGKITFNTLGTYTVTMTNNAIISHEDYPAEVTVEITVGETGIVETPLMASLRVFPNPTNGQLKITNYELREGSAIEIFDVVGRVVWSSETANNTPLTPLKGGTSSATTTDGRNSPLEGGRGVSEIVIDVSGLANGMYFLKVDNKVVKFIKE